MMNTLVGEPKLVRPAENSLEKIQKEDSPFAGELEFESSVAVAPATVALWTILATVVMLFAGFASAYLVRRASPDWVPIYAPPVLWVDTALLLFSSVALELAKTSRKFGKQRAFRVWFLVAVGLGAAFLVGQWVAWSELAAQGIFLPTSAHGSFFFMLSAVHSVHVSLGMVALGVVLARRWNKAGLAAAGDSVNLCATYWHFVTGIWVFLYWLLFVWR